MVHGEHILLAESSAEWNNALHRLLADADYARSLAQALADPRAAEARAQRAHAIILANYTPENRAQRLCELCAATMAAEPKATT